MPPSTHLFPWFISIGLLLLALLTAVWQLFSLKKQLVASQTSLIAAERQLAVTNERLTAISAEGLRKEQDTAQRFTTLSVECDQLRGEIGKLTAINSSRQADMAALQTRITEERKAAADKLRLLEQAEVKLTREFENLANRIFDAKQEKFSTVSQTGIESLLTPMREQLESFRLRVDHVYDRENRERASLLAEINQLKSLNERIGADALNLTRALKGDSKLRGNWGEMQLARLLEESGLEKGREYEVQAHLKDEAGHRLYPDVVVHLPEKKDVVIDSKVSLLAYEQYHAADSDREKQGLIRNHILALRSHIKDLSAKNYDELVGVNSLDMVIMFVPIEPALLLAFEHEPNLFSEAFNRHILLVSPSTLMATLQIIHNIWRHEQQNLNAQEIATEAGRLHDQFVLFIEALEQVGDQLQKATASYETAHKRLTSGRGNLLGRTMKLQKLGAKTKKTLTNRLVEDAGQKIDGTEDCRPALG